MEHNIKDFRLFAKDQNINGLVFDEYVKKVNNSLTPMIMESRELNSVTIDVFSRLIFDRIIFLGEEVTSETCNIINAQLLYLAGLDERAINIYINSPGGSVIDGLSVIDVMNYIKNPISTTCVGTAASMGAVLLSCGDKGMRNILPHGRVMIHQVSSGMWGKLSDMEISLEQTRRCKRDTYEILAQNMDKTFEEVEDLCKNDNWFIGQEAVDLGIVDNLLSKKN